MKTQKNNVYLQDNSFLDKEKGMERLETIVDVFKKEENPSYAICFLGSGSNSILRENEKKVINRNDVKTIVNKIFSAFLSSQKINNLKIITSGGGGLQELIPKYFRELRVDNKEELESRKKNLQLIAITVDSKKRVEYNSYNDYCIKADSATTQNQAMINLSYWFIGLPGGKTTLSNILMIYNFLTHTEKNKGEYRLWLHSFWRNIFQKGFNINEVSFFNRIEEEDVFPKNVNLEEERVRLKKIIPTKQEMPNFEGLKDSIVKLINKDLFRTEIHNKENSILAIDFSYYSEIDGNFQFHRECYSRKMYEDYIEKFSDNILFCPNKENVYGVTILPNGIFNPKYVEEVDQPLQYKKEQCNVREIRGTGNGTFEKLASYFNERQYGQTLMWRRIRMLEGEDPLSFSIILLFNYHLPLGKILTIKRLVEDFITTYSPEEVSKIFKDKNRNLKRRTFEAERQARKSAYAQVFIRNLSHNIISHVLVHLQKGEELSPEKLPFHIQRPNAYQASFQLPWEAEGREMIEKEQQEQLATFLNYISNRCFYLNESVYGVTNMIGEKKVYGELFKELDKNRILLNHISGIDNFKYQIHFIKEVIRDGKAVHESFASQNDISVMLPGDILGQQAFYNIIENIIRNTAKHNVVGIDDCVHFVVMFSDLMALNDFYIVRIFDSIPLQKSEETDSSLYEMLHQSAFNKENKQLRSQGLGLLEMKAAAAFLRQKDVSEIENPLETLSDEQKHTGNLNVKDYFPYVNSFITNQTYNQKEDPIKETESSYLGYFFLVKKVEKYLFVVDGDIKKGYDENRLTQLQEQGVSFLSLDEFKKSINEKNIFNHEFVFFAESAKEDLKRLLEALNSLLNTPYREEAKKELEHSLAFLKLSKQFYSSHQEKKDSKEERIEELSLLPERLMLIEDEFIETLFKEDINTSLTAFETQIWEQWEGKTENNKKKMFVKLDAPAKRGIEEDCRQVVFFDHLGNKGDFDTVVGNIDNNLITIEPLSSAAQQKLPHWKPTLGEYVERAKVSPIAQKLIEAYFNKIIVIDERIQDFAETKDYKGVSEKDIYRNINVLIPNKEPENGQEGINLANRNISEDKEKVEDYIDKHISEATFLVIHYGILERMYGSNHMQINAQLKKWAEKIRVVVSTGRGKYSLKELPQGVTYLNFSALKYPFIDNRNKYSMNYILNQSRR